MRSNYGSVPSKTVRAEPNTTAPAADKTGCYRHCTKGRSSNYFWTAHSIVRAADRSGSHSKNRYSSSHGHHLTAKVKRPADCRCKRAHWIVNSRSQARFQNPPTAAGLHARTRSLGLCQSDDCHSDD